MPNKDEHYLKKELYELIQNNEIVSDFFEKSVLDGIWYWDVNKPESRWISPNFWVTLGYDPIKHKGATFDWQDFIHPDDLNAVQQNFEKHYADPTHPYNVLVRYKHANGSWIWVQCKGIAVRDENGTPKRMLLTHINVTPLKQAQHDLSLNTHFQSVFEHALVGIAVLDEKYIIHDVNDRLVKKLGWDNQNDLLGKHISEIVTIEWQKYVENLLVAIEPEVISGNHEIKLKNKKGDEMPYLISITSCLDPSDEHYMLIVQLRDLSRQKMVEDIKDQFVSLVAHQLRTPLAAMRWSIQEFSDEVREKLSQNGKEKLEEIIHLNKRLGELISIFLKTSEIELALNTVSIEEIDLQEFLSQVINDEHRDIQNHNLTIDLNIEINEKVCVDKHLVDTAISNLLTNAIKYSHDGGIIVIECKKITKENEEVVVLTVKDDGIGIPQKDQEHLFKKLFRAENAIQKVTDGNGLGLYMLSLLVNAAKGSMHCVSKEGEGATFIVEIPIKDKTTLNSI